MKYEFKKEIEQKENKNNNVQEIIKKVRKNDDKSKS